jgi:hypothetical protein
MEDKNQKKGNYVRLIFMRLCLVYYNILLWQFYESVSVMLVSCLVCIIFSSVPPTLPFKLCPTNTHSILLRDGNVLWLFSNEIEPT